MYVRDARHFAIPMSIPIRVRLSDRAHAAAAIIASRSARAPRSPGDRCTQYRRPGLRRASVPGEPSRRSPGFIFSCLFTRHFGPPRSRRGAAHAFLPEMQLSLVGGCGPGGLRARVPAAGPAFLEPPHDDTAASPPATPPQAPVRARAPRASGPRRARQASAPAHPRTTMRSYSSNESNPRRPPEIRVKLVLSGCYLYMRFRFHITYAKS